MTRCPETRLIQDWLDGELAPERAARLEAHVAGCAACSAEASGYRALFGELRALPLLDPRPELFHRIMDEVLPQRAPRWVKVVGWTYAGAFATSLLAIASAVVLPGPSAWLHGLIAAGMRSLTGTGTFVLRSLSDGLARFGEALAGDGGAARWVGPLGAALAHPVVWLTATAALSVCAALLWWMRPRERDERPEPGEMPHVGLLGL